MTMKKTAIAVAMLAITGAATAAPVSTGGVFTMYSAAGFDTAGVVPGGSIVGVDATISGFVDQAAGTWGVSSTTAFFGNLWTASNGQLIKAPGSYVMNAATGVVSAGTGPVANDGSIYFTVGAGQTAGTIDFAYGPTTGIRVVDVWNINSNGSLTPVVVPGMENGPFPGFNAAFTLTAPGLVPIPAAAWLLGSGLVGLIGLARRRKAA